MENSTTRITSAMKEEFTKKGYWKNKILLDYFEEHLKANPDKVAVVDRNYRLTYRDLEKKSNQLATSLRKLGIVKGDVVSFQLPNWYHTNVILVALIKLGVVINPIIPIYREREVAFIMGESRSKAVIIPDVFRGFNYVEMFEKLKPGLPHLQHIIVLGEKMGAGMLSLEGMLDGPGDPFPREKIDPNDIQLLLYTSGTTAQPKGVQHTHNTLVGEVFIDTEFWRLNKDDVVFSPTPVTHISGYCNALHTPLIIGASTVHMDIWDPEKALDLIEKEKCTFIVAATPFLQHMLDSPTIKGRNIPKFFFVCGGAYIPPELIKRAWKVPGWRVIRVYGSSEAPTVTLGIRPDGPEQKASETDGLIHNYEVRIVDFDNSSLPPGQDGEIIVKGPKLFVGYRDQALNEESFDAEGWFHTGDLGRMSADGYLEITGRKKDIIIRGGENLSVKEIEDMLHAHPLVDTAAAVAMPDVKMGEKVCAYIKLKSGASLTLQELQKFLAQQKLAKQKWPERLEIISEFPMTPSGKIRKNELRKDIAEKMKLPPLRI